MRTGGRGVLAAAAAAALTALTVLYVASEGGERFASAAPASRVHELFARVAREQVRVNNWDLGCHDLFPLLPYLRAMQYSDRDVALVLDVGAHEGSDALAVFRSFVPVDGMCRGLSSDRLQVQVISVEAESSTHCKLANNTAGISDGSFLGLRVALSDRVGMQRYAPVAGGEQSSLVGELSPSPWVDAACFGACLAQGDGWLDSNDRLQPMREQLKASECETRCVQDHISAHDLLSSMRRCDDGPMDSAVHTLTVDAMYHATRSWRRASRVTLLKVDAECFSSKVVFGAVGLMRAQQVSFVLFEVCNSAHLRQVSEFASGLGYACFLLTPAVLLPVDPTPADRQGRRFWYEALDHVQSSWWANALCGIRGDKRLRELWNMYHAHSIDLIDSFELLGL